ncbi:PREDICTED: uncharacterized protein LOC109581189 [Amphimedon queenslandica]|uniref:Fibronectin type-III domain-containing protein n=1 Tax=Amphimedon queenslandica TaxID=400682 RepID=A0AAN0J0U6_AMPQE|nr:PREDICTED: uncharacterized protein LOC109581189 [Amphimedon queenslandica]|eukprot:XP_019850620.1 PREDICTED: uncharacterized protein LOC109581189 [Amphimedon queenslandica]
MVGFKDTLVVWYSYIAYKYRLLFITIGYLGPVTNIDSSIDNCSTIDITWTAPTVDDGVSILYYILKMYDAITCSLVDTVSVYDTREGISNSNTFSYQRAPKSVNGNTVSIEHTFQQNTFTIIQFSIPVMVECTGEAPDSATVTVHCNETGGIYSSSYIIDYTKQPNNITGSVPVLQYQRCNISIVFSNEAGSSEPFILAFDTYPLSTYITTTTAAATTTTATIVTPVSTTLGISTGYYVITAGVVIILSILIIIISLILLVIIYKRKAFGSASLQKQQEACVPTTRNEAYEFNNLVFTTDNNPAYEEIGGNRGGPVSM